MSKQLRYPNVVFWGFILFGLILPFFAETTVRIIFTKDSFINILADVFIADALNSQYGVIVGLIERVIVMFIFVLITGSPFIVLAFFAKYRFGNLTPQKIHYHVAEIIGAGAPLVSIYLFVNFNLFLDIYYYEQATARSGVILFYLPFRAFIPMLMGGVIGSIVGRIISRAKKRS